MARFAEVLKRLREAAGLSQYALAQKAGISKQAVNKLEGDSDSKPTWDTVQALAAALGVSCEALRTVSTPPVEAAPEAAPESPPEKPARRKRS